jgi:hypothetical protein
MCCDKGVPLPKYRDRTTSRTLVCHKVAQAFLSENNLNLSTIYVKVKNPVKPVASLLPGSTPVEDIRVGLQEQEYGVTSLKQVTVKTLLPKRW